MNFEWSLEFQKDFKKLSKKWRSLARDIKDAELLITDVYSDNDKRELFQQKFFNNKRASKLVIKDGVEVVKMRLDVADLGSNNKVRMIFIARIIKKQVLFIEIYAKNEKDREDYNRIRRYL